MKKPALWNGYGQTARAYRVTATQKTRAKLVLVCFFSSANAANGSDQNKHK
jgi:hypothetical protein